jgi:hypothetical protein
LVNGAAQSTNVFSKPRQTLHRNRRRVDSPYIKDARSKSLVLSDGIPAR